MLPILDETEGRSLILYAITGSKNVFEPLAGVSESRLYWIDMGGIGVVVSPTDLTQIRAQRVHLQSYHRVIAGLMQKESVLPFSFGSLSPSLSALRQNLIPMKERVQNKLKMIQGTVEMAIKVSIEEENKFAYLAREDRALALWLEELRKKDDPTSHMNRIEAGQNIEKALKSFEDMLARQFQEHVAQAIREYRQTASKSESIFLDFACLVNKEGEEAFHTAVREYAKSLSSHPKLNLKISGPFAPFTFSTLE